MQFKSTYIFPQTHMRSLWPLTFEHWNLFSQSSEHLSEIWIDSSRGDLKLMCSQVKKGFSEVTVTLSFDFRPSTTNSFTYWVQISQTYQMGKMSWDIAFTRSKTTFEVTVTLTFDHQIRRNSVETFFETSCLNEWDRQHDNIMPRVAVVSTEVKKSTSMFSFFLLLGPTMVTESAPAQLGLH